MRAKRREYYAMIDDLARRSIELIYMDGHGQTSPSKMGTMRYFHFDSTIRILCYSTVRPYSVQHNLCAIVRILSSPSPTMTSRAFTFIVKFVHCDQTPNGPTIIAQGLRFGINELNLVGVAVADFRVRIGIGFGMWIIIIIMESTGWQLCYLWIDLGVD